MYPGKLIGDCPICGDELYIFHTKTNRRLIKCINDKCPKHILYPIPHSGSINTTGLKCQKARFPLLLITPHLKLRHRIKDDTKRLYFWAAEPCFNCSLQSRCSTLIEAKKEFCEENDIQE
jgi:ssDNA-binding Zn-finger/Zn-ribbon topoisomerase 1